jgi:hypothetical protein
MCSKHGPLEKSLSFPRPPTEIHSTLAAKNAGRSARRELFHESTELITTTRDFFVL